MRNNRILLPNLILLLCVLLFNACKKESNESDDTAPIGAEDRFNGVYVSRDPSMNPPTPDHRYIRFNGSFHRMKNSTLFGATSIADIAGDTEFSQANIKNRFLAPGSQILGLQKDQYARMIYVEFQNKRFYFRYGTKDQGQWALGQVEDKGVDTERDENTWWIIHEFPDEANYKEVAIEAYANRGYFIMNAGTLDGETRIRILENHVLNATRWEIYKP